MQKAAEELWLNLNSKNKVKVVGTPTNLATEKS